MKVKVMVVDDSGLYRQMVKNVLRNISHVEVVGLASSGKEALEKIPELQPELLTLDVQMPHMNGLELLKEIRRRRMPVKAIMLSSLTAQGAQETTDALMAGAFDFIQKPSSTDAISSRQQLESLLVEKIQAFQQSRQASMPGRRPSRASLRPFSNPTVSDDVSPQGGSREEVPREEVPRGTGVSSSVASQVSNRIDAIVIGTSTGGPMALRELIPKLPSDLGVPIFVVQHMPPKYTHSLAVRLNEVSQIPVVEAADRMKVEPNHVYIAPGGYHMGLENVRGKITILSSSAPHEHNCRPAVDFTFRAACNVYAGHLLAVILTGMGRDGADGCRRIKQLGGTVFAQHPEGCTVYGMPKVIVEEHVADRVIPLEKMALWITRLVSARSSPGSEL